MPSVAAGVLRSVGDHEIATGRGHGSRLREGASGGKIGHFKKNPHGRWPHAKQSSDRSGPAPEKRRQGNSRRRRHGRKQQGSDLPGRVRQTRPVQGRCHDRRQRVLDRLDDQGHHGRGRHATGRARQALARRADRQGAARPRRAAGARRLRRQWRAEAAAGEEPDHAAPSHDPHRRLRLQHVERRHGAVSGEDRHAPPSPPARTPR